jgi:arylsulfatase A-like enzyme
LRASVRIRADSLGRRINDRLIRVAGPAKVARTGELQPREPSSSLAASKTSRKFFWDLSTLMARRCTSSEPFRLAPLLASVALVGALGFSACEKPDVPTHTVVLISIDTLRPDRLGVYGNTPDVSPAIDALAKDAVVFDQALAPAPWTLPSTLSMLTGLDPVAHGVETPLDKLPDRVDTLAELLAAKGFETAAFTAGGFVGTGWGYEQGFGLFDASDGAPENLGFSRYIDRAVKWIEERRDKPYFLFLHTFDVHAPYDNCTPESLAQFRARPVHDDPRDYLLFRGKYSLYGQRTRSDQYGRIGELINDYDAGVHDADNGVARVLDALKRTQRYDDALVIVVSDHGEGFCDHGLWVGHGLQLTDNVLHVPLIVKFPGDKAAGTRIEQLVDLVDLAPTVLAATGLPPGALMQGTSLRAITRGERPSRDFVFGGTYTTATYFIVRDGYKLIGASQIPPLHSLRAHLEPITPPCLEPYVVGDEFQTVDEQGQPSVTRYPNAADPLGYFESLGFLERLYDRDSDPLEHFDLARQHPSRTARMRDALQACFAQSKRIHAELIDGASVRKLMPVEQRQLQALGYTVGAQAPPVEDVDLHLAQARANPPAPPPKYEVLVDIDRRVHRIRLALRDHGKLEERETSALRACANEVAAWVDAVNSPPPNLRALWRVLEIQALATQAGQPFDAAAIITHLTQPSNPPARDG